MKNRFWQKVSAFRRSVQPICPIRRHPWLVALVFLTLLTVMMVKRYVFPPLPEDLEKRPSVTVLIPQGATFGAIADTLMAHSLLKHREWFLFLGRITGKESRMHAGMFAIPRGLNSWQLLVYLESAKNVLLKVTIPEGLRTERIAAILQRKIGVDSARFMQLVRDSAFVNQLGVPAPTLDGFLMPETYFFQWKTPEEVIIRTLVKNTMSLFEPDSVRQQLQQLNMSILEIITLASIIEGEVMVDSERVLVSSVYHNRLKRGWRLQADPTIQFLLKDGPRRLTYRDLEIDSPYNTYKYAGLPPGPINNPGKQSILAAIFPAKTRYLYFVASGDGGHRFSRTLKEHLKWKRHFDKIRREVYWKKRQSRSRK
ncbi:MAG: endolytic transglycosylase MltG [Calditrichaeota bacterium]|nr:endolytic transglycosylase MltG [Calditrichota bacterium]